MKKTSKMFFMVVVCLLIGLTAAVQVTAQSQAYSWKNVEIVGGGYVPAIIYNAKQANLVYARTDIGGAYKLNTSTNRWMPLTDWVGFDNWSMLGIDALATDPVDPNRLYLAAGMYTNSWSPINGSILRSTDQGATWAATTLPFKFGGNMPGRNMGERLEVDPNKNSIIYFGARLGQGLWKSTDYGVTWAKVSSFTAVGTYVFDATSDYGKDIIGVVWITFDPRTGTAGNATQTIYVGVADKGNSVFRSTDGGATWAAVPGQPTGYLPHHGTLGSNGLLYVTYSDTCGPYDGSKGDVYKYDTATATWTMISPVPSTSTDDYFGYGALAVDAQAPNTIMTSSLNSWWPDAILFRSIDAGTTWTRIWDWTSYPSRSLRYTIDATGAPWLNFGVTSPVEPVPAVKVGWMIGDLKIDPFNSNKMMYGTGATIWGCDDLLTWDSGGQIALKVKAQGLEETAVLDLISPPAGANLFSALGDIAGFKHVSLTTVPSAMYATPFTGSTTSIDYAELSTSFIVRSGNADTANNGKSTGFSYDGGSTWFQGNNDIGGTTGGGVICAAANASRVVWAPAGGQVSYSTDNGNSWIQCQGVPAGSFVGSDRVNSSKFYAFSAGTFYRSIDGGVTFTAASTSGLPTVHVQFRAVPGIEGDIWLTGGDTVTGVYGMWHSTDSGTTFTKLTNVTEADTIGFGMPAAGKTYKALYTSAKINGVRGIFRSDDTGATWIRINDDAHQYGCTNEVIIGDPRIYGRVYLGSNGRGILYGDPSGTVATPTATTVTRTATATTVTRTATSTATATTVTRTATATTVTRTATATRTATTRTATPTRTSTTVTRTATATTVTRTATSTTVTRTATATTVTRTATATATATPTGATCPCMLWTPATSITPNFAKDGAGQFLFTATTLGNYINSWNLTSLKINCVEYVNIWVAAASLPPKINGLYYVCYDSAVSYGHFEAMN